MAIGDEAALEAAEADADRRAEVPPDPAAKAARPLTAPFHIADPTTPPGAITR